MITPDGSVTGEVMGGPRNSNSRGVGRKSCQEPNQAGNHLSAKHEGWADHMVGEALYQHTLMIMRNRGNDSNGINIDSRKWVESECGIQIGETVKTGRRYR